MPQQFPSIEGHVVTSMCQRMEFTWQRCVDFRELSQACTVLQLWPEIWQPEGNGVDGIGSGEGELQVKTSALVSTGFVDLVRSHNLIKLPSSHL